MIENKKRRPKKSGAYKFLIKIKFYRPLAEELYLVKIALL